MPDSATVEKTDAELIAAVLGGDTASFEPLLKKYQPRVFATARHYARRESEVEEVVTMVDRQRLTGLLQAQLKLPPNFNLHPKLKKLFQTRSQMAEGKQPLDWAAGEALAFATLATEGCRVRLTGQDTQRGTFSHRHAMLRDYETGHPYMPLQNLAPDQSPVEIYNSPLSEAGVLGFEYGYSLDCPDGLVMWEAQFGDFINAAQVIIDQFIISAEDKWRRLSGLVLLLPLFPVPLTVEYSGMMRF